MAVKLPSATAWQTCQRNLVNARFSHQPVIFKLPPNLLFGSRDKWRPHDSPEHMGEKETLSYLSLHCICTPCISN